MSSQHVEWLSERIFAGFLEPLDKMYYSDRLGVFNGCVEGGKSKRTRGDDR